MYCKGGGGTLQRCHALPRCRDTQTHTPQCTGIHWKEGQCTISPPACCSDDTVVGSHCNTLQLPAVWVCACVWTLQLTAPQHTLQGANSSPARGPAVMGGGGGMGYTAVRHRNGGSSQQHNSKRCSKLQLGGGVQYIVVHCNNGQAPHYTAAVVGHCSGLDTLHWGWSAASQLGGGQGYIASLYTALHPRAQQWRGGGLQCDTSLHSGEGVQHYSGKGCNITQHCKGAGGCVAMPHWGTAPHHSCKECCSASLQHKGGTAAMHHCKWWGGGGHCSQRALQHHSGRGLHTELPHHSRRRHCGQGWGMYCCSGGGTAMPHYSMPPPHCDATLRGREGAHCSRRAPDNASLQQGSSLHCCTAARGCTARQNCSTEGGMHCSWMQWGELPPHAGEHPPQSPSREVEAPGFSPGPTACASCPPPLAGNLGE